MSLRHVMEQPSGDHSYEAFQRVLEWYPDLAEAIERPIHELVREKSGKHPDAPAICSWDGEITYGHLENLSSRLACYIAGHGVMAGVIVPLVFEKSKWMILSLLAVLKAGGTFLMLDPSQPTGRLKTIVEQTAAQFAITSSQCSAIGQSLVETVFVVDDKSLSELEDKSSSLPSVEPSTAAYTIFTSGSTGTPKGVIIEHRQLSSTSTYVGERLGYTRLSRVFQFASYAFDACITDIFATLVHGGTICIPSEWQRNNATIDAMNRMKITHAKFTPSLAQNLALDQVSSLRTLMFGGESPPATLVERWASRLELILVYGPTECCVICFTTNSSDHKIAPGEIGTPIASRGWIVKQNDPQQLAAINEVGELLIEGPLVGRGYLNDAPKTEKQFIINPEWMPTEVVTDRAKRLYRTGDLARYLSDGRVSYVGRVDNQVKIRGQRLELEEVETALRQCLSSLGIDLKSIVVEAIAFHGLAIKHLVAFLNLNDGHAYGSLEQEGEDAKMHTSTRKQHNFAALVSNVRHDLSKVMPAYAVPTLWVPIMEMPYTISRKIDRKLLRQLTAKLTIKQIGKFVDTAPEQPLNGTSTTLSETSLQLRKLWASVFELPESAIEAKDNFFALGGDSVLAIKMIAAARSEGLDLSLQLVFKHPSLHAMALNTNKIEIVDNDLATPSPFSLLDNSWDVALVREEARKMCSVSVNSIEDIYPCSPMQEGLMALSMKDPGTYILQFVYQMPEDVDLKKLKEAWESVSASTQVLRTRFFDYDSNLLQAVVQEPLGWKVVEANLADLLAAEKELKMNVGEPMSRHTVVRQPHSQHHFLVWNVQHALVDGWTESDIVTMVEKAYYGDRSSLSAVPKFNRFIDYLGNQDMKSSEEFWKQDLAGVSTMAFPPLPNTSYVPKVQRSSRILHHFESHADAEIEHKVRLGKRGSTTPATMIQAAWFILIGLYSNSTDVVTGVTLNGRAAPLPAIDQIPGPTVTTIPFRTRFSPEQFVAEYLERVQTHYLDILPHAQLGLQNIRALSDDAVAACKFRTLLVVQSANQPRHSRKLLLGRSYSFPVMDFALVMECELVDDYVEFRATFDHQILTEDQVRRMFQVMEGILRRISNSGSATTITDLQALSREDHADLALWHKKMAQDKSHSSHYEKKSTDKISQPPSTPTEKKLASIWSELLHFENIHTDDHFFQIGGGSVSAMRLVSLARREGLTLTVSEIFRSPVLRDMALVARERVSSCVVPPFSLLPQSDVAAIRLQAALQCRVDVGEIEDVFPVHAMQLHYVAGYPENERNIKGPWDWQSQAVYTLPAAIDVDKYQSVWHQAIRRHETLRTRAISTDQGVYQAVLRASRVIDWHYGDNLEAYKQSDRNETMSFGDELLRLAIVRDASSPTGRYFVITLQHFIYDGFARHMLFKEIETAYFDGLPETRLPKMNQLIKYLITADKAAALDYWTRYLSNVNTKPMLEVPEHCYEMDTKEHTIVTDLPKIHGTEATLPTIIEVVAGLVISQKLDCADVILYSDRSGRNLPVEGIQDLVGPTTLFLPVRIHRDPTQSLRELLHQAQEAQRQMLAHEHLGWLELRQMTPFRHFYRHAVNMNINPNALSSYTRLGLEYQGSYASCDDPFGINVDLYDDRIEWTVYYDERFISHDAVGDLLAGFKSILSKVGDAVKSDHIVSQLLE